MKTYRSPRDLLAKVKQILARKPFLHGSPLAEIITLLCRGRHYSRMAVYLAAEKDSAQHLLEAGGTHRARPVRAETRSEWLLEVKIAGRTIGMLEVESDRENAFASADRVLLENVARILARFLTGRGKYLVRKARQSRTQSAPARGPRSVSLRHESKTAAVGE